MTKKNRWWLMAVYIILAVLVVLVVASCFIPVSKKPDIDDPLTYELRVDGVAETFLADKENSSERYNEVNKEFNDSFSESFLVSLFSGRIGYTNSIRSTTRPSTSGYTLYLYYNSDNAPTFTYNNTTYYYDEIRLTISEDKGMTSQEFYYVCSPELNNFTTNTNSTRYFLQTFIANFDGLYDYLTEAQA